MKAINIIWDVENSEDLANLPTEIDIPYGMNNEDEISDYISNQTGYCHKGFSLDYNGMTIYCPNCEDRVAIKFNTAICDSCGWSCTGAELDEIMLD